MHVSTTIYYGSLNMINNNYFNHFIYRLEDANGLNDNDGLIIMSLQFIKLKQAFISIGMPTATKLCERQALQLSISL